ncbi:hypothetical protein PGT21_034167 [Puccinia graminis f. sp. tritici]|uniref:Uncharacterized protein n=1 Tax=Puccinia graminis f. sp. tritici TaxID=56615 RepID=A0A5B0QCM5_PUCGR|nr:hypothetical protein PGT21_034167 [Puccinia graminis f. sp. tritici]
MRRSGVKKEPIGPKVQYKLQSSVPSLSNQPAPFTVGRKFMADADEDTRNNRIINTCDRKLETSTSIPFIPLSLKSPPGQVERNLLIHEPLGITARNCQAPTQTHQANDASTGPCTVLLLRNFQFPQEIERNFPADLNIRVQQASHSSNGENVATIVPFDGVSLGHLSRPDQYSVEAIKNSAGNIDHHSPISPVLNIEGRRATPYAFQDSLPSKPGETPLNGARESQTHTNAQEPHPETESISLLPSKLKEMQQRPTLPPREKGKTVEGPDSDQATAAPLLESELNVASTHRSARNLRMLARKSSKRTSNLTRLDAYPQSQQAKKIKLGAPSSNISPMRIHSRQRGSGKFIVPVEQKDEKLTDIFKFNAANLIKMKS